MLRKGITEGGGKRVKKGIFLAGIKLMLLPLHTVKPKKRANGRLPKKNLSTGDVS